MSRLRRWLRDLDSGAVAALLLAVVALVLGIAAVPEGPRVHGDGYYTYLWARSMVFDGDVDFANDYRTCADPWGMASMPHGEAMNQWNPGPALFWAPYLLWARVSGHPALESEDPVVRNACLGVLAENAVKGSYIAGVLLLSLCFFAARRVGSNRVAAVSALLVVGAGPIGYYVQYLLSYGHAASGALAGIAVFAWWENAHRVEQGRHVGWRGWVVMGAGLGVAMLARPQNVLYGLLPLSLWLRTLPWEALAARAWSRVAAHVAVGVAFSAALLVGFALQLAQWFVSTGEWFLVPQGDYYLRLESPRLMNLWFSSANGLFTWCPITYPAVAGLGLLAWRRETRALGLPLVATFALVSILNASVADWWGAVGYAARRFDAMGVPFAIGLAVFGEAALHGVARHARAASLGVVAALALAAGQAQMHGVANGRRSDVASTGAEFFALTGTAMSQNLWRAVGNPLAWPASIPFALRHGVHPRLWDHASMPELFFHRWLTLERQADVTVFDPVGAHADLAFGFGPLRATPDGQVREVTRGRAFLPLSYPYLGGLRVSVVPFPDADTMEVWVELDGEVLGARTLRASERVLELPVRGVHQGVVELRVATRGGVLGVQSVELLDRTPAPAEAQARRNALLREQRVAHRRAWGLAN